MQATAMGSTAAAEVAASSSSVPGKEGVDQLRTSEDTRKQHEVSSEVQNVPPAAPNLLSKETGGDNVGPDQGEVLPQVSPSGPKRKRNKKERGSKRRGNGKKSGTEEANAEVDMAGNGESVSVATEEADPSADNLVLKKLLRWPRYFDAEIHQSDYCYNCGEQGHFAKDCNVEKRKRPCFICGLFGHAAKACTLGMNCYICNKSGHIAKDCPDKHQKISQYSDICLRCGNFGHNMFSCTDDYSPKDLQEIQCYICNKFGHVCCYEVSNIKTGHVSCYNCGQSGHSGVGCAKTGKRKAEAVSPSTCYVCGEEGHFARGCVKKKAKYNQKKDGSADQSWKPWKEKRMAEPKSAPPDVRREQKKKHKSSKFDEWNLKPGKSKIKGGWIVDDPGDYVPYDKYGDDMWASPSTPYKKGRISRYSAQEHHSRSWSAYKKPRGYVAAEEHHSKSWADYKKPRGYPRTSSYSAEQHPRTPKSYDGSTYNLNGSGSRSSKSRGIYWR